MINDAAQRLANEPKRAKSIEAGLVKAVHGILNGTGGQGGPSTTGEQPEDAVATRGDRPEQYRRERATADHTSVISAFERIFSRNIC